MRSFRCGSWSGAYRSELLRRTRRQGRPNGSSLLNSITSSRPGSQRLNHASRKGISMGQLLYGDSLPLIEFDDRVLAHLKVGIFAKFRRH